MTLMSKYELTFDVMTYGTLRVAFDSAAEIEKGCCPCRRRGLKQVLAKSSSLIRTWMNWPGNWRSYRRLSPWFNPRRVALCRANRESPGPATRVFTNLIQAVGCDC